MPPGRGETRRELIAQRWRQVVRSGGGEEPPRTNRRDKRRGRKIV